MLLIVNIGSPGLMHFCNLQYSSSVLSLSLHGAPPLVGIGESQNRSRDRFPRPQVTLHGHQGLHVPHEPSTKKKGKKLGVQRLWRCWHENSLTVERIRLERSHNPVKICASWKIYFRFYFQYSLILFILKPSICLLRLFFLSCLSNL